MPKISSDFSLELRSFLKKYENQDPHKIDTITHRYLVLPVSKTISAIVMRIVGEKIKAVDEISNCMCRNNFSKRSIRDFQKNINIITDYYVIAALLIERRMTSFVIHYTFNRRKSHNAAITLRIKSIAQAEMLYGEVHSRLGQLNLHCLEARGRVSMENTLIPMLLDQVQSFAKMIIEQNLTWKPPRGKKYPLCARNFDIEL